MYPGVMGVLSVIYNYALIGHDNNTGIILTPVFPELVDIIFRYVVGLCKYLAGIFLHNDGVLSVQ
jgi:uncharacterized membrane protein